MWYDSLICLCRDKSLGPSECEAFVDSYILKCVIQSSTIFRRHIIRYLDLSWKNIIVTSQDGVTYVLCVPVSNSTHRRSFRTFCREHQCLWFTYA